MGAHFCIVPVLLFSLVATSCDSQDVAKLPTEVGVRAGEFAPDSLGVSLRVLEAFRSAPVAYGKQRWQAKVALVYSGGDSLLVHHSSSHTTAFAYQKGRLVYPQIPMVYYDDLYETLLKAGNPGMESTPSVYIPEEIREATVYVVTKFKTPDSPEISLVLGPLKLKP